MFYIAQVTCYTGLMYLVYLLFLRNRNLHGFNRFYLLATIIAPLIIPFIKIPQLAYQNAPAVAVLQMQLPEYVVSAAARSTTNSIGTIFRIVYAVVSAVLIFRAVYSWSRLKSIIRKHKKVDNADHTLVYDTGYGPGSWYRYILLPQGDVDDKIIRHELIHVRLRHSIDMMVAVAVQLFCWPNVFLVWIKKELLQVHEFQADAGVNTDPETYSQLLISSVFNTCTLPMTHSFIIHPIKRRIIMLTKNKKKMPVYAGFIAGLSAAFLVFNMVSLQSCKSKTWDVENKSAANAAPGEVYKIVDQMPQFNGDMMQFLAANTTYPETARANKTEGKVMVQFVVGSDGQLRDIKTVGKAAPDTGLARAAIEAVSKMPAWIPGEEDGKKVAVQFTLPVSFKLK